MVDRSIGAAAVVEGPPIARRCPRRPHPPGNGNLCLEASWGAIPLMGEGPVVVPDGDPTHEGIGEMASIALEGIGPRVPFEQGRLRGGQPRGDRGHPISTVFL